MAVPPRAGSAFGGGARASLDAGQGSAFGGSHRHHFRRSRGGDRPGAHGRPMPQDRRLRAGPRRPLVHPGGRNLAPALGAAHGGLHLDGVPTAHRGRRRRLHRHRPRRGAAGLAGQAAGRNPGGGPRGAGEDGAARHGVRRRRADRLGRRGRRGAGVHGFPPRPGRLHPLRHGAEVRGAGLGRAHPATAVRDRDLPFAGAAGLSPGHRQRRLDRADGGGRRRRRLPSGRRRGRGRRPEASLQPRRHGWRSRSHGGRRQLPLRRSRAPIMAWCKSGSGS